MRLRLPLDPRNHRRSQGHLPDWSVHLLAPLTALSLTVPLLTVSTPQAWSMLPVAAALPALSWIDIDDHRLPDSYTIPLFILSAVGLLLLSLNTGDWVPAARALTAVLITELVMLASIAAGADIGLGDLKLMASLALTTAFAGEQAFIAMLLLSTLINGAAALALLLTTRATRRSRMPLGPALLIGWMIAVATNT